MSRTIHLHTAQTHPTASTDASTSVPLDAKIEIIRAAIEDKKEPLAVLAATKGFSFTHAAQALDVISELAEKLPKGPRERFVTQVALPLITREPLDLLTICLSCPSLRRIRNISEELPSLLVEHPLKQLAEEIANGEVNRFARSEILPIGSHAISYRSSDTYRPYRKIIDATMRTIAEILDSHPLVNDDRHTFLGSTTSINLVGKGSLQNEALRRVCDGAISLVVEPTSKPFDLATSLIREDQLSFFERTHGLCQPKEVVADTYRQRCLGSKIPLVASTPAYPSMLLREYSATVKAILFQIEALNAGLVPQNEVAAVKSRVRRELIEAQRAEPVLSECIRRRDFNRHGVQLTSECRDILSSCTTAHRTRATSAPGEAFSRVAG